MQAHDKALSQDVRSVNIDSGSFRDPSGHVFFADGKVYRCVNEPAIADYEFVESTGLMARLVEKGWCVASIPVDARAFDGLPGSARIVLEHPRISFVSYPYEWPFSALKAAALLHLDVHLEALKNGVTLSDASAYNIQFEGVEPVFIDRLSFVRYRDGEIWTGHRQFCEQFLNPLLLRALVGIPHNAWYRGRLEGISTEDLNRVLPLTKRLSGRVLAHVVLQAGFQKSANKQKSAARVEQMKQAKLPLPGLLAMLHKLRAWIARLEPADTGPTVWGDYAQTHSYASHEHEQKHRFVAEFVETVRPRELWDLGCNTGDFSMTALEAGTANTIGFDADQKALDLGFSRSSQEGARFLPLYLDAANPSPDQGWAGQERKGLGRRASAEGLLALAFVHHLAITKNIPLDGLVGWLVSLAPHGVIEFVPKSDPMVQELLRFRQDIFDTYTEDAFLGYVSRRAEIVRTLQVTDSGRKLIWYRR